jgi:hypothetical protein
MTDLVTYCVPEEDDNTTLIHQESSIVPDVGEQVTVNIEHNECDVFEVASRRYRLNSFGEENRTQVILRLEEDR